MARDGDRSTFANVVDECNCSIPHNSRFDPVRKRRFEILVVSRTNGRVRRLRKYRDIPLLKSQEMRIWRGNDKGVTAHIKANLQMEDNTLISD